MSAEIKILETFRDAVQGLDHFIPTEKKIISINELLKVGFDILDVGSFVSPGIIPQFSDMDVVMRQIDTSGTTSELFVLVANKKGAEKAKEFDSINYFGFPFSTSETFLRKNINRDFESVWSDINEIQEICLKHNKTLIVYEAMAFGNPYGDPVNVEICLQWAEKFSDIGVGIIHLSDIIGVATPAQIAEYYQQLTVNYPTIEFGIHLHDDGKNWQEKVERAFQNNCKFFDGVISGLGGCPMTGYELLSNLQTSELLDFAQKMSIKTNINHEIFWSVREKILTMLGA